MCLALLIPMFRYTGLRNMDGGLFLMQARWLLALNRKLHQQHGRAVGASSY